MIPHPFCVRANEKKETYEVLKRDPKQEHDGDGVSTMLVADVYEIDELMLLFGMMCKEKFDEEIEKYGKRIEILNRALENILYDSPELPDAFSERHLWVVRMKNIIITEAKRQIREEPTT